MGDVFHNRGNLGTMVPTMLLAENLGTIVPAGWQSGTAMGLNVNHGPHALIVRYSGNTLPADTRLASAPYQSLSQGTQTRLNRILDAKKATQ